MQYVSDINVKLRNSFTVKFSNYFFYCRIQFSTFSSWSRCWEDVHFALRPAVPCPPPHPPQHAAAQCLQVPPSQRPVTGRSVRQWDWQKGTPVLSVIRRAGLWQWLPIVASQCVCLNMVSRRLATRSKRAVIKVFFTLFSGLDRSFAMQLNFQNFRNFRN